jgi:cytoskeleton-associated protein 5
LALLEEVKYKIGPFLGSDFVQTLTQRLTDSNKNIASQAADICGHLATSMGKPFEKYAKQFLSPMLVQLNDQKSQVRANVLKNLSKIKTVIGWGLTLPILAQSLISENPTLRKDLLKYISTEIDEFSNISVLVQPVLACAQDRNLDVRKNAQGLLAILAEHMDIAQIENIANELYRGSAFSSISNIIEGLKGEVAEVKKPVVFEAADKKKPVSRQVSTTSLKREIAPAAPKDAENPIISVDLKAKDARSQMDKGLLKWSFEAPRKELIDLLADQCAGNLSSQVCSLLFSTDHYKEKDYLIGLKLLDDYIAPNDSHIQNECVANCDIILKYVTVRFFDTNTSILIKTLDLLEHLIAVLDTAGYFLSDYEANCFLPFFVQKTGDPKESIRMKMRQILKQLGRVYPVSKLFGHLLRGLESKNAKTRQECLDELSQILQRNGQDAFNPSKSLPLIAALISDRDASVRNSSLAFVCQAYKILGEEVFSYAGRLSDKDLGMIKERLKRMPTSDTSRASTPVKQQPIVKSKTPPNVPKEFTLDLDEIETITPCLSVAATPSKVFEQDPIELFVANFGNNSTEDVELLKQIDKLVSSSPLKLRLKANDVASVLVDRLAIEFEGYKNNFNNGKVSKYITNTLVQLFNNMEIAQSLTADVLDKCIRQVLLRLVDAKLLEQDGSFSKALNVLMVRVIENSSPNCTFKSLLSILKDITDQNLNDKYSELVMKCMWKITKVLGNLISSRRIVVEDLLFDIHVFLLHAPPQYWKRKSLESKDTQADMPLRTVKTIIHEVVGALGGEAMDYALLLPNSQQNHVVNYIRQMVINLEKKNKPVAAPKTDLAHQLDDIFTLISDKENTKNGILKLYEFQRQNPAEFRMVEDRISQTGSYFQGYIHRGLAGLKQSELQITTEKMASSGASNYH